MRSSYGPDVSSTDHAKDGSGAADLDACLALLDLAEAADFERDGYLVIRNALDDAELDRLTEIAAVEDATFRAEPGVTPHHVLNRHDLIARDAAWLGLIDHPRTFPKVWGVLGWNIQVFHTQLIVTPPAPDGAPAVPYAWHQDNNRMNLDLETEPQPRVSVKVGYFLTDLPDAGMGNLAVVPGSHRRGRPPSGADPVDGLMLTAAAGDAVMFDRRLWHAASTNATTSTRVFVTVGYSYRWLRTKSEMRWSATFDDLDPVRRQLLGAATDANGRFEPTDEDVPLRDRIRAASGPVAPTPTVPEFSK